MDHRDNFTLLRPTTRDAHVKKVGPNRHGKLGGIVTSGMSVTRYIAFTRSIFLTVMSDNGSLRQEPSPQKEPY
jgi:hypothetical protein